MALHSLIHYHRISVYMIEMCAQELGQDFCTEVPSFKVKTGVLNLLLLKNK